MVSCSLSKSPICLFVCRLTFYCNTPVYSPPLLYTQAYIHAPQVPHTSCYLLLNFPWLNVISNDRMIKGAPCTQSVWSEAQEVHRVNRRTIPGGAQGGFHTIQKTPLSTLILLRPPQWPPPRCRQPIETHVSHYGGRAPLSGDLGGWDRAVCIGCQHY